MSTTREPLTEPTYPTGPEADPFRYGWRYVKVTRPDGTIDLEQVPLTLEDVLYPEEEDFIVNNALHARDCHYLENALLIAVNGREDVEVLREVRVDWGVEGVRPLGPDLAVFEDLARQGRPGVFQRRQLLQRLLVGAGLVLHAGPSLHRQFQLVEQHLAQLRQRADVELVPGQGVDFLLDAGQLLLHLRERL